VLLVDGALTPSVLMLIAQQAQLFDSLFGTHGLVKGRVAVLFSDLGAAAMATPLLIERLGLVDSTQTEAADRFSDRPVLVSALGQRTGRGRSGADWENADRSVAASLALQPEWPMVARVTLVAGLAATDVLPDSISLKWPNDIMIGELKVGGILTEAADSVVVVGFGLNVFWASPPIGAGAVHESDPGEGHSHRIAERWAVSLLERIAAGPTAWGREEYLNRCSTIGRAIEWEPDGSGVAVGVDPDGALLVETAGGVQTLSSGEVRHVRPVR
jgi:BirA family biotin operon repressor/biotin-[acetyl-CoA-carboxylase] ligase